jgi:hypothetical protein
MPSMIPSQGLVWPMGNHHPPPSHYPIPPPQGSVRPMVNNHYTPGNNYYPHPHPNPQVYRPFINEFEQQIYSQGYQRPPESSCPVRLINGSQQTPRPASKKSSYPGNY